MEFGPGLSVPDLPTAVDAVRAVGRPDFRLLIDTMHLVRSGSGADDLVALDPATIGAVQLSDVPLVSHLPTSMDEAIRADGAGDG
jgi:sugar phosphate isomerase/epimerase